MKRKIVEGLLCCLLMTIGCGLNGRYSEIEKNIQQELNRTDIKVVNEPNVLIDSEHLTDYLWEVQTTGDNGITFHVVEDYYGADGEKIYQTDYDTVQIERAWNQCDFSILVADYTSSNGLKHVQVTGSYKDEEELNAICQEVRELCAEIQKFADDACINLRLTFDNPLRKQTAYDLDDGDYSVFLIPTIENGYTDIYQNVRKQYLLACMEYQFTNLLQGVKEEEFELLMEKCNRKIGREKNGTVVYYNNVCASSYGYGVSFGALYEILQQEEIETEGDAWHYSFQGTDGKKYEISYDFCNYIYDVTDVMGQATGEQVYGYFYVVNGEEVPMDEYYLNHFDKKEIEEMTGLKLLY